MKQVLRSVIDFQETSIPLDALTDNLRTLIERPLSWDRLDDKKIFSFVQLHFKNHYEAPSYTTVRDYFDKSNDIEVQERLKDVAAGKAYIRSNFHYLVKTKREEQHLAKGRQILKEVGEIWSKGLTVDKKRLSGVNDGLHYLVDRLPELMIADGDFQTKGNIREDGDIVWNEYCDAELHKERAWGHFTGINEIDKKCRGIKKGELWIHAGFASELKTTFALNWVYNLMTWYKVNTYYASLEMKYAHIRKLIYTMHSTHTRFKLAKKLPLEYRKIRDGELTPKEKTFFQEVVKDLVENPEYCALDVHSPERDMTIDTIRTDAEVLHKKKEVGLVVIDHGGLVEARRAKQNKDYVIEINSVIRDAKRLALHFNGGEGVAVLLLFQMNRQGKDMADKNDGIYKISALSYSNECISKGTLIQCITGFKPIEEVQIGDSVWSRSGWKRVLDTFDQGKQEVFNVKTHCGLKIEATSSHRLRILEDGQVSWCYVRDLVCNKHRVLIQDTEVSSDFVKSVTPAGITETYDIEVGGDHEYASAGFFSHNCERSADVITTTYLNDDLRKLGQTILCNLKNRDNPKFDPFRAKVDFATRRIHNLNAIDELCNDDDSEIEQMLEDV